MFARVAGFGSPPARAVARQAILSLLANCRPIASHNAAVTVRASVLADARVPTAARERCYAAVLGRLSVIETLALNSYLGDRSKLTGREDGLAPLVA